MRAAADRSTAPSTQPRAVSSIVLLCGVLRRSYGVVTLHPVTDLRFEWDDAKNAANEKKHGVSFEEARSVFYDERARS